MTQRARLTITALLHRYLVGGILLVVLLLVGELLIVRSINLQEREARAVNVAGRQRMLSQRVVKNAFRVYLASAQPGSQSDEEALAARVVMKENIELFMRSYLALRYGSEELGIPPHESAAIEKSYAAIEQALKRFHQAGLAYLKEDAPSLASTMDLNLQSEMLLLQLDALVVQHEIQVENEIAQVSRNIYIAIGLFVLMACAYYLFIFRPLSRNIVERVNELQIYRQIIESAHESIVITDPRLPDNPVVYVNSRFLERSGYVLEEVLGKNCRFLQGPDTDPGVVKQIRDAIETKTPITVDIHNYTKHGDDFWQELSISPVRDIEGRLIRYVSMQSDITERKRTVARLRASESLFKLFVENSPAAIAMLDTEMRYLIVSRTWVHDYGLEGQDILGRSHYELFPDIPERWKRIHAECLKGATQSCEEDAFPREDGGTVWLRWEVRPWHNEMGDVGGIIMFTEVITARKEAEQRLRTYRFALESMSDATYWILPDGSIEYANQQACGMLGYWLDELQEMKIFDIDCWLTEDYWSAHWRALREKIHLTIESTHRCQDGREIPVEVVSNYLQFEDIEMNCAYARDISARKIAEEALRTSEERLVMALEGANDGLWDWNIVTGEVYFSPRWYEMLGYEDGELPGSIETWNRVAHPADLAMAEAALELHFSGKTESYVCEHRCRCKDGSWVWILDRGKVVARDEQGMPQRMVGTHTDVTRRREAEIERDRFFDISQDLLCIATFDGRFVRLNPEWTVVTGWTAEELMRTPFTEFVHPDDLDGMVASMSVLQEGAPITAYENRYRCKDGHYVWLSWSASPYLEGGLIYGVARDMTEMRIARDDLQKRDRLLEGDVEAARALVQAKSFQNGAQQALYALGRAAGADRVALFESHTDPRSGDLVMSRRFGWVDEGIADWDEQTAASPWAKGYAHWLAHLQRRESVFGHIREMPSEAQAALAKEGVKSILVIPIVLSSGLTGFLRFDMCRRERVWDRIEIGMLSAAAGTLGAAYARERSEEQRQQLAAIVQSSNDAILSKNLHGIVLSWNPGAEKLYGYSAEEIVGQHVSRIIPQDRPTEFLMIIEQVRKGEGVAGFETVRVHKDGRHLDVSLTVSPVYDVAGRIVGASVISHDISERKRFIAMLDQKNHQLEEYASNMEQLAEQRARALVHADRLASIGTLSAGVAHEINNPVSFIAGNLDTLQECWPAMRTALEASAGMPGVDEKEVAFVIEEMPEILSAVGDGVSRITSIVSGLKAFAREDTGIKSPCRVERCIAAALALTGNRLKYNVTVEESYAPDLPSVLANEQQLEQVLVNLMVNAADAMAGQENGRLFIDAHTEEDGAQVVICVRDSGAGIPEKVLARMWDPFFTTKDVGEGTGLGLAISRGIIEDHGGTITATNAPEGGALFRIVLPVSTVALQS